jgi:hypothetical protein
MLIVVQRFGKHCNYHLQGVYIETDEAVDAARFSAHQTLIIASEM